MPQITRLPAPATTSGPFVRHGSLYVDRSIDADFRKAEAYLRGDSIMRKTFDDLERGPRIYYVTGNARNDDHYGALSDVVTWDPHSALRTSGGGRQSPALGLGHELAHADEPAATRHRLAGTYDARYDTKEERRVIDGAEAHAARSLGESVRRDHLGDVYRVASPTAVY